MWPFFNPTTEVVTFCLRGQCMLGVFLLPQFIRLWQECQIFWVSAMECMCAGLYSHLKEFKRMLINTKGKIPSTGRFWGGSNLPCCMTQDSEHIRLSTELFWPPTVVVCHWICFRVTQLTETVRHVTQMKYWLQHRRLIVEWQRHLHNLIKHVYRDTTYVSTISCITWTLQKYRVTWNVSVCLLNYQLLLHFKFIIFGKNLVRNTLHFDGQ